MRILLVEDEIPGAMMLAKGLRQQGYAVDIAETASEAEYKTSLSPYDLILLDLMLDREDGLEICRELRRKGSSVPILVLTARDAVGDRVLGLDAGADDYLTKPFDYYELLARIRALLRRRSSSYVEDICVGDLLLRPQSRTVSRGGVVLSLTAKEYAILEYLAIHQGQLVTRASLSEHAWDENYDPFSNLIEVYVLRLRKKIDGNAPIKLLKTRRGEGYILSAGNHHAIA